MQTVTSPEALRAQIRAWRHNGQTIAFVPTMGNLHQGHIKLVEAAHQQADRVVVSVFVNPTQFGPHEDFEHYPRTTAEDSQKLQDCHTDLLFLPDTCTIYPQPSMTQIMLPELANRLCGLQRPGHFDGVALVVCKLLNLVQPDKLVMGEKDFQQLAIIRRMVEDLNIPVQVIGVATVRETDGLAMSSRNGYLSTEQRQLAPALYQSLLAVRDAILTGTNSDTIVMEQQQHLAQQGVQTDYLTLCRRSDLHPATPSDKQLIILIAARLGTTRLIDNLTFDR